MQNRARFLTVWLVILCVAVFAELTSNHSSLELDLGVGACVPTEPVSNRCVIAGVDPAGPAARAGIENDDVMLIEEANVKLAPQHLYQQDSVTLRVFRGGRQIEIRVAPRSTVKTFESRVSEIHGVMFIALLLATSLLIGLSRRTYLAYQWLAYALLSFTLIGLGAGTSNVNLARIYQFILFPLGSMLSLNLFLIFWRSFAAEIGAPFNEKWRWIQLTTWFLGVGMTLTHVAGYLIVDYWGDHRDILQSVAGNGERLLHARYLFWWSFSIFTPIVCVIAPLSLVRQLDGEKANSGYWVAAAFCAFFIPWSIGQPSYFLLDQLGLSEKYGALHSSVTGYLIFLSPLSLIAFMYLSVARQLLSFQFFLNKTFAYFLAGLTLLLAFLLIKSNVEELLPKNEESQRGILNGVIAVLVFLAKQFKEAADTTLKKLIFVNWSQREARLIDYRSEIRSYTTVQALIDSMRQEISRFCRDVQVDIFERKRHGFLERLQCVEVPIDGRIPVLLRARHGSIKDGDDMDIVDYRLIVPLFDRFDLKGFVAVRNDPRLSTLRPDEVSLIEKVVRQCAIQLALIELDNLRQNAAEVYSST